MLSTGVLTKPDRMPQGDSLALWSAVLSGDKFGVGHGYYVTKQPSQLELNRAINHAEARASERSFFQTHEPWATSFSGFQDRFGTPKLQQALSKKLTEQIRARLVSTPVCSGDDGPLMQCCSLPDIRTQVQKKIEEIDNELRYLPEPPTINAQSIVISTLSNFSSIMQKLVEGAQPYHELRQTWRHHCQTFRDAIISLRPTLIRKTDAETAAAARAPRPQPKFTGTPTKREHGDAVMIESDSDREMSVAPEPTPSKRPRMMVNAEPANSRTPQKRRPVKANGESEWIQRLNVH